MKISNETMMILKKFAEVNTGLVFKEGMKQSTVSPQKNILVSAVLTDEFPKTFAIYELNRFLSILTTCKDPELEFNGTSLKIVESNGSTTDYVYSDPSMIIQPPSKELNFPETDVEFKLTNDQYESILKKAAILSLPEIAVVGDGSKLSLTALDTKNDSSDKSNIPLGTTDKNFQFVFKLENLKLFKGDYDVKISKQGISHFSNIHQEIQYFIATETSSSFNG